MSTEPSSPECRAELGFQASPPTQDFSDRTPLMSHTKTRRSRAPPPMPISHTVTRPSSSTNVDLTHNNESHRVALPSRGTRPTSNPWQSNQFTVELLHQATPPSCQVDQGGQFTTVQSNKPTLKLRPSKSLLQADLTDTELPYRPRANPLRPNYRNSSRTEPKDKSSPSMELKTRREIEPISTQHSDNPKGKRLSIHPKYKQRNKSGVITPFQ